MKKEELLKKWQKVVTSRKSSGISLAELDVVMAALGEAIGDALADREEVTVPGLGKWVVKDCPERQARNPMTGKTVTVPACLSCRFKVSETLKRRLNGKA